MDDCPVCTRKDDSPWPLNPGHDNNKYPKMVGAATGNGLRTAGLTMEKLSCFKAYDVRGRVPEELNEDLAYRIGRAYAAFLSPARVAVGRDIRFSSLPLAEALTAGLNDGRGGGLGPGAVRHGAGLFRHLPPGAGRRHHGHRQPQPPGIQRHEVRAGRVPAAERRLRSPRDRTAGRRPGLAALLQTQGGGGEPPTPLTPISPTC